jgi:hypothetical protein
VDEHEEVNKAGGEVEDGDKDESEGEGNGDEEVDFPNKVV